MAHKYLLAYYYVSPQDAERIDASKNVAGDSEKTLITQYVRGWLGKNRSYYLKLARFDAENRGITFRQWGETIISKGIESLPSYVHEVSNIPLNPLRDIALAPDVIRRNINYIMLGTQNLALLKIAIYYDRDNAVNYVSRIVKEHLERNWQALYASQVEAENFDNWI